MTQPNEKAEQSKKTTAANETSKQPAKKASKSGKIWIAGIFLILGGVAIASYLARGTGDTPRPVVSADEEPVEESFESVSGVATGALVISSDIRGADVYLNGKRVGKTPHKATPLTLGRYQVKVMKAGYETFEKDVEVSSTDDTLRADLKPAADGARDIRVDLVESSSTVVLNEAVAVKHKHRIRGGCEGVLRASAEGIRFETEHKDAFFVSLLDLERINFEKDKLNLKVQGGKSYNFVELDDNGDALTLFHERVDEALMQMGEM